MRSQEQLCYCNSWFKYLWFTATVFLFFAPTAWAKGVPTPVTLDGGSILTAEQAMKLHKVGEATFIDVRNPINFGRGHIPKAISIPYKGKSSNTEDFNAASDEFNPSHLPVKKHTPVVFYSHGVTGWKSYKAAVSTIRAGYSEVSWFRGGYSDWVDHGYSIEH